MHGISTSGVGLATLPQEHMMTSSSVCLRVLMISAQWCYSVGTLHGGFVWRTFNSSWRVSSPLNPVQGYNTCAHEWYWKWSMLGWLGLRSTLTLILTSSESVYKFRLWTLDIEALCGYIYTYIHLHYIIITSFGSLLHVLVLTAAIWASLC